MTQAISVITKDYALLASDRRLIFGDGPRRGELADDDTCKLVSVCNICGVGYTGLAKIEASPTHEWIAKTLASNGGDPSRVGHILQEHATRFFCKLKPSGRIPQEFLVSGWGQFSELSGLRPFMRLVTNLRDQSGRPLSEPADSFANLLKVLVNDQTLYCWGIGQPLRENRWQQLEKNLQRLVKREIGPSAGLRLLVDEIVNTALVERNTAVGAKILGFCIPKGSVERQLETGHSAMLAKQPDNETVTFTYFESGYSELRQYGPTFVCGENAYTDIVTENDPAHDFQSSQFRILSVPKSK